MAFLRHGCSVSAVVPAGHAMSLVPSIGKLYRYSGTRSLQSLRRAILSANPNLIVPCDDHAVLQLHALHAAHPDLRPLIELSLGSPAGYSTLDSRHKLLTLAAGLGIRTPLTLAAPNASAPDLWPQALWPHPSAVLKLDATCGGAGVCITHSQSALEAARRRFSRPLTAATAVKRLIVNRNPVALWSWRAQPNPSLTLQQFIPGRPANSMIACWQGEVLASVTVEVLASQGETGSATIVRFLQNDEIDEASRKLARELSLSGFHGLDFILPHGNADPSTQPAHLIELNPRCTQLGHLVLPGQGDLAGVLLAKLTGKPSAIENPIRSGTVAFFPQALTWNPDNPFLSSGFLDIPTTAPALIAELQRKEWPYRQLPARIYHHFFPPDRDRETPPPSPKPAIDPLFR